MTKIVGRNGSLYLFENNTTCQSVSGVLNQITLNMSAEAVDVTGFGNTTRQRLSDTVQDWELAFSAFFDSVTTPASQLDAFLFNTLGGSTTFLFGPNGSSSGSIRYAGCGVLTEFNMDFTVDGAATIGGTVVARTGSITRGTWS